MKVSVIDLGFNSAKLVSCYVNHNNSYRAYDQKRIDVRLGSGLDAQKDFWQGKLFREQLTGKNYLKT